MTYIVSLVLPPASYNNKQLIMQIKANNPGSDCRGCLSLSHKSIFVTFRLFGFGKRRLLELEGAI